MLRCSTRRRFLSRRAAMYAARLYGTAGGAGGGGGGLKQGRRAGLALLEAPPPHLPHHLHPPPTYPVYPGRPDRGPPPHYQHLAPPPPPPPHRPPAGGRRKTWSFIQEQMSYDTFFTMKRLIERSCRPDEVLRWVTQNPAKVSHNHYAVALQRIGQLLQAAPRGGEAAAGRRVLDQPDFQTLCDAIVSDCAKFDNFSVVNCLYAVASLGLPGDAEVVAVLEAESQSRLSQFNQKDVSMVFSSSMRLHPSSQHPLTEACLAGLERHLERERHPQTLFLLLSYYRLKWRSLQTAEPPAGGAASTPPNPEQLVTNRKILRLVKHTLASVSGVRDQEMALLDEMLAACAREASNKSLELIFSSHLFYQNRQEKFISSLAEELPKKVDSITPYTMALIAKYVARHRLRETRLLDSIADFLIRKAEYLDSKVLQKLVFPFSRMSYRPSQQQFFSRLEAALELKALCSPLATVNILMSLFQLGHFPGTVLHRVFSSAFISNVTNSPYALIVRRYLSLLDAAVELEYGDYAGPRLQDAHKVLMFDQALTADEVNRKYSYKGLVAEALRQLLGEHGYKQDEVLPPGYYTDFVLCLDGSGRVLPIRSGPCVPPSCIAVTTKSSDGAVAAVTAELQGFSPFTAPDDGAGPPSPAAGGAGGAAEDRALRPRPPEAVPEGGPPDYGPHYGPAPPFYPALAKEPSVESQDSSTLSSPPSDGAAAPAAAPAPPRGPGALLQLSIGKILEDEGAGFYSQGPGAARPDPDGPPEQRHVRRVILSVNDKWHYCHNSEVLVGSRAMRDRHLRLLGYVILQLPFHELEKLNGIEEVKLYLQQKLLDVPL